MSIRACIFMGLFWNNSETKEEETGEYEKVSAKVRQKFGELECEEAILKDKERFGRARKSMMDVLRAKHGDDLANRALSRVNKRLQKGYFS